LTGTAESARLPLHEGLLIGPLDRLDTVHLAGTRCNACAEVSLGASRLCPNCGGSDVKAIPLGNAGTLWSYTIIRHCPPGDYHDRDNFQPFGMGLVEVPEGLRVLAPIMADIGALEIGMPLRFEAYVRQTEAAERVLFRFVPANGDQPPAA
jgi:uncharacterized OB-fold protein